MADIGVRSGRSRRAWDELTPQEQRIAVLAARGDGNREIGHRLCLSERTVKTHIVNVLRRTRTRNRTHLVATLMVDERFRDLVAGD